MLLFVLPEFFKMSCSIKVVSFCLRRAWHEHNMYCCNPFISIFIIAFLQMVSQRTYTCTSVVLLFTFFRSLYISHTNTHLILLRYRSSLPGLVRPSFVVHGLIEGRKLEMANITWIWCWYCWWWRCRCRCCMCNDLFQIKMVMVIYGINTLVPEICAPPCAVQKC